MQYTEFFFFQEFHWKKLDVSCYFRSKHTLWVHVGTMKKNKINKLLIVSSISIRIIVGFFTEKRECCVVIFMV